MFVTSLSYREKGYPQFIKDNEEQRIIFQLHQSDSKRYECHSSGINSIFQTKKQTIISSKNQINCSNRESKKENEENLSERIMKIKNRKTVIHPIEDISVVVNENNISFYNEWNKFNSKHCKNPSDVIFLVNNLCCVSSEEGIQLYDMHNNESIFSGSISLNTVTSLGTDGVDLYCCGDNYSCIDLRTLKTRWTLDISGKVTMKNGIGIVSNNQFVHSIDLDSHILCTFEKHGISSIELTDDGLYCFIGFQNGEIHIFDAINGCLLKQLDKWHSSPITSLNWSSSSMELISGSNDGVVVCWDSWNIHKFIDEEFGDDWL